MVEIAKGLHAIRWPARPSTFTSSPMGATSRPLIEKHGFALTRMEPRLTTEKIEHIAKVDRGEKFTPAFTDAEMIQRVENEVAVLKRAQPRRCRHRVVPVDSRQLPRAQYSPRLGRAVHLASGFLRARRGHDRPRPAGCDQSHRRPVHPGVHQFLDQARFLEFRKPRRETFWCSGIRFDFRLLARRYYAGRGASRILRCQTAAQSFFHRAPRFPKTSSRCLEEVTEIPRDKPLIYFAMGSSGTREIVARIIEGFEGRPYRVIAPVKFQLAQVPNVRIPSNVLVTDWVPALQVNKMADLAVIHGGIGTVMTAALAGKPVVGVGMQMEQVANLACLERLGFAIRVRKSRNPSRKVQEAIRKLLGDEDAKEKAAAFAEAIAGWDGPKLAAERLYERYGHASP